ncbi:MAG: hypothetical protein RMK57_08840 [Bryobacterales bacterium]|nr:hypothetical protein [Bryobacteraceae bacterium]MDW8354621.1 hypothetical protein [Bryobacterales bacterium]
MDLYRTIRELYEEKKRIEEAIASLEQLLASKSGATDPNRPAQKKRRGRKSMGPEERRLVSERMKKFWAQRRARGQTMDQRQAS